MASSRLLAFLCFFVIPMSQTTAQPEFVFHDCFNGSGKYDTDSTYQTNLNSLLSKLTSNTQIDYGFYNLTYGQDPGKVYATGLCRGDVKPDDCRRCLNNSEVLLPQLCPYQKQAFGGYDECMLLYSNVSIFGDQPNIEFYWMWNGGNATNWDQYNKVLKELLEKLRSRALAGDSRRKFAAGNATGPSSQTIYGLVQCQPDLTEPDCEDCLERATLKIPEHCNYLIDCRIFNPSCNLRYENFRFYEPTAETDAPPASIGGKSNKSRTVSAIVVPIAAFVVLLMFICIYLGVRKRNKYLRAHDKIKPTEILQLDFDTTRVATNNFADANKLGQGGFGPVYKGRLADGQEVAIKRLSQNSSQGDTEFRNEVMLMAGLQHRNLVRLLGFCLERRERLLVYEFVPNKSLDSFLFDPNCRRIHLDWERRCQIITGIARGLLYLHQDSRLRIIHRDLKASNILLDKEMNPKISDFGMARLFGVDQTHSDTRRIVGTHGYMAPEYVKHGHFSVKSDVFSFGVLILEIVSGHKNNSILNGDYAEHLVSIAWKNWREGTLSNIVDTLLKDGSRIEILRCIHIGLLCVQENVADRPTMSSVVLMLNSDSVNLPAPSQPAFYMSSRSLPNIQSGEYNSGGTRSSESSTQLVQASANEASSTEPYPR